MLESIGVACLTIAVLLDLASYYRQIRKTLYTKKSRHVSTTAFMLRMLKDVFVIIALSIYENWVGVGVHVVALIACFITLYIVAKYKPSEWRLFS